jgi:hypothetical protein
MASFNIDYPGKSADFVVNANQAIKTKGGVFSGDASKGNFSLKTLVGAVQGNYQVISEAGSPQTKIAVTITKKPFIVPMKKIQEVITGYF